MTESGVIELTFLADIFGQVATEANWVPHTGLPIIGHRVDVTMVRSVFRYTAEKPEYKKIKSSIFSNILQESRDIVLNDNAV